MPATRLLFLSANPADTTRLALDEEVRAIQLRLRSSGADACFTLSSEWALRAEEIQTALLRHRPHLVHFSAHGLPTGELCLVRGDGDRPDLVLPEALRDLFQVLAGDILCIVLNACHSIHAAQKLAEVLPCAVGMAGAVSDSAAIAFAAGFYEALAFGRSVHSACELGRSQIRLAHLSGEYGIPQVVHRETVEPKQLFVLRSKKRNSLNESQRFILGERLQSLYVMRGSHRQNDLPVADLENEIVSIKRQQRQGHQLNAGEVLDERYSLLEIVGQGGFAKVWQAIDLVDRRLVALKVLRGDLNGIHQLDRFERGAHKMLELNHPHIVRVLSKPTEYEGFHYFAMEYVRGGDLAHAVLSRKLSQAQALQAVLHAGKALQYAHEHGLIHRDVKPSNILLDEGGDGRLTDFDLVWAADTTGGTRTGAMGTFLYAAPELLEDAGRIDHRADVYALGMTALFVLYGRNLPSRLLQDCASFVKRLDVASSIKAIITRAIAWNSEERYPTAEAFVTKLEQALLQAGLTASDSAGLGSGLSQFALMADTANPVSKGLLSLKKISSASSLSWKQNRSVLIISWGAALCAALGLVFVVGWRVHSQLQERKALGLSTGAQRWSEVSSKVETHSALNSPGGESRGKILPPLESSKNPNENIVDTKQSKLIKTNRSVRRKFSLSCTPVSRLGSILEQQIYKCANGINEEWRGTSLVLPFTTSSDGRPVFTIDPAPLGPRPLLQCLRDIVSNSRTSEFGSLPRVGSLLRCTVR